MNVRLYNANPNISSIYGRPLTSIGYKESMFSSLSPSSSFKRYSSPERRPQTTSSSIPSYISKISPRNYYATPPRDYRSISPLKPNLYHSPSITSPLQYPFSVPSSQFLQRNINNDYNDFDTDIHYTHSSNLQELKDQILSPGDDESSNDILYARNNERIYENDFPYRPLTGTLPSYKRPFNLTQTNFRKYRINNLNDEDTFIKEQTQLQHERSKSVDREYRHNNNIIHYNDSYNNLSSSFSSDNSFSNNYNHLPKYKPYYIRPQSALLPQYNNTYSKQNSFTQSNLLPPSKSQIKKTLILDLDETLVHSDFRPFYIKSDITLNVRVNNLIEPVYVLKRPYVDEFLQKMSTLYEIVIFTASIPQYANPLLDILDNNHIISYRLFREHCVYNKGLYIKDLNKLGRNLKDVLIVDNNPISYASNKENGIPIPTWHYDKGDTELLKLIPILEYLSHIEDVRDVIKRIVYADKVNFYEANNIINNNNTFHNDYFNNYSNSYRSKFQYDIHNNYGSNRNEYNGVYINSYMDNNKYTSFGYNGYQQRLRRDMFEKERQREMENDNEIDKENDFQRKRMFSNTSSTSFYSHSPSYYDNYDHNRLNHISLSPSQRYIHNTNTSIHNITPYYYNPLHF